MMMGTYTRVAGLCSIALFIALHTTVLYSQGDEHVSLVGHFEITEGISDIWGYTDTTSGIDYALVATISGMSIIDATTDEANPVEVAFLPGAAARWKDIKTWKNYSYLVSDVDAASGLEIVDLTDPTNPVFVKNFMANFGTAHNLYIDENGFAYVVGTNTAGEGMIIFDLADPENPVKTGQWTTSYIHDVFVRNDTAWASLIESDQIAVIDVSDKANPVEITRWLEGRDTHNSWLTDDGNYLLVTEERSGGHLKIWDIRDLNNISVVSEYESMRNLEIHNVFVMGDFAYISYYEEGLKIVDISDPTSPGEVGDFDLFPTGSGSTWGVFPYTSSGLIYVGNSTDGFYSARFDTTYAGHVRGTIKDDVSGALISGAQGSALELSSRVFFDTEGNYKYAAGKDSLTFSADAFGYFPNISGVSLIARDTVIHDIFLTELPKSSIEGVITDVVTGDPIDAEVILILESDAAPDMEIKTFTDANGAYSFESVYISFENEVTYPYLVVLPEFPYAPGFVEGLNVIEGAATEISFEFENADVLLYNGDIGDDYVDYYAVPLDSLGVTFHLARKNIGDVLQASRIDELTYPVAIWYTGDLVSPVLSAADEDSIISFLDAGGRIFLTGQNIVEDLSPTSSLLTDYLSVSYGGESTSAIARGVEGNVVTDGLGLFAFGGAENQSSLDILVPTGSADSAMLYGIADETVAAISVEDPQTGYKIFLTGFGLEGLRPATGNFEGQISLLADVLTWFGVEVITGVDDEIAGLPEEFILEQNYPNPFNPVTRIEFSLGKDSDISLIVYSILGNKVATLYSGRSKAGSHVYEWDGKNDSGIAVSSGIYLYRLQVRQTTVGQTGPPAVGFVKTKKMVLIR